MSKIEYVVGCPAWERGWSLDLWFKSVKANVDPSRTGLVFVVPASDQFTRDVINENAEDFAWLVVERDRNEQFSRDQREEDKHATLATARNQILAHVNKAKPDWFLSWDSDLLLPPGTIEEVGKAKHPISTVWTWLNRQEPRRIHHVDPETGMDRMVRWQEPMAATAMKWEKPSVPVHYPGEQWFLCRRRGWMRVDVCLAFKMMNPLVYSTTMYKPHPYGEDIPFNWSLEQRKINRWCYTSKVGVHLYKRDDDELSLGWPDICQLEVEAPLAATTREVRSPLDQALGFYPEGTNDGGQRGSGRNQAGTESAQHARPGPGGTERGPLRDAARSDHGRREESQSRAAA